MPNPLRPSASSAPLRQIHTVAFLNPLLLFGIIGIAAPIIIHLLAKKRIKRTVWAAMKFLKLVVEKNQRRLTLEDFILLLLRCAVLLFLALAMARPSFKIGRAHV